MSNFIKVNCRATYNHEFLNSQILNKKRIKYRYSFNTQEKVDEISGTGNHTTALFWEYDSRIGRRWNVDPAYRWLSLYSPYSTMGNNPIVYTDEDGDFVWNLIIGAITGGIVDMAFQVGEQMLSGQNFGSALEKVVWKQVGWSILEGAGDALFSSPAGMLAKMTKKLSKYPKLKELMGEIGEVVYEMGKAALKQYNEKGLDGLTGEWFAMAFEDALISRGLDHLILKKTPSVSTTKAQIDAAKDNFEKVMKTSPKNDIATRVSAKKQVTNSLEAHGSNVITQVFRNNLIKKAVTKGAQNVNTSDGGGRPKRKPGPIPSF